MRIKNIFTFLIVLIFVGEVSLFIPLSKAEIDPPSKDIFSKQENINIDEDPLEATLKALNMAKKAVLAVEEAAKAVAEAAKAIEEAKAKQLMPSEELASHEKNLVQTAQAAVLLSQQAAQTVKEATEIVLAVKSLNPARFDELLAVALKKEDFPWLWGADHLQSLASVEKDLVSFIESKLFDIQRESPETFEEMQALIRNPEEMEAIINKVQRDQNFSDEYVISVFQSVYIAFGNMGEQIASLRGALYEEKIFIPANQEMIERAERYDFYEERARDQRLELNANR